MQRYFILFKRQKKQVKSLLYYKGITAWGHSIVDLLNSCEKIQISVNKNIKNVAQKLEKHYSSSRYPDALPDLTPKEAYDDSIAEDIQQKSQKILDFVTKERENIDIKEKQKSDKNKTEDLNNDFEIGTILFNAQKYNAAVFHFVQAAEKASKIIIIL